MRASAYPVAILATLLACAAAPLWAQALDDQVRQPLPVAPLRPVACPLDARLAGVGLLEPACRALLEAPARLKTGTTRHLAR